MRGVLFQIFDPWATLLKTFIIFLAFGTPLNLSVLEEKKPLKADDSNTSLFQTALNFMQNERRVQIYILSWVFFSLGFFSILPMTNSLLSTAFKTTRFSFLLDFLSFLNT